MYEYRHVILPKEIAKKVPKGRLLTEHEWRHLGVQQSLGKSFLNRLIRHVFISLCQGWVHFMIHEPGSSSSIVRQTFSHLIEFCFRTAYFDFSSFFES